MISTAFLERLAAAHLLPSAPLLGTVFLRIGWTAVRLGLLFELPAPSFCREVSRAWRGQGVDILDHNLYQRTVFERGRNQCVGLDMIVANTPKSHNTFHNKLDMPISFDKREYQRRYMAKRREQIASLPDRRAWLDEELAELALKQSQRLFDQSERVPVEKRAEPFMPD